MANVHAGHRARLREKAKKGGLSVFAPHEIIELLLMQIIPQRDVNPLAHALTDRFGSLEGVLTAPEEELVQVKGVGPRTAQWLRTVGEMAIAYAEEWRVPEHTIANYAQAVEFLKSHAPGERGGYALVSLDHSGRVLFCGPLPFRGEGFPDMRVFVRAALEQHAAQVFTVHEIGCAFDFEAEKEFAIRISDMFGLIEIIHLDHIVILGENYYSARRDGVIDHVSPQDSAAAEEKNK